MEISSNRSLNSFKNITVEICDSGDRRMFVPLQICWMLLCQGASVDANQEITSPAGKVVHTVNCEIVTPARVEVSILSLHFAAN